MRHDREQTFDEVQIRLVIRDGALVFAPIKEEMEQERGYFTWPCTSLRHCSAAALLTFG